MLFSCLIIDQDFPLQKHYRAYIRSSKDKYLIFEKSLEYSLLLYCEARTTIWPSECHQSQSPSGLGAVLASDKV